jgi:GNAT superfamily N-acetyltransferase
MVDARLLDELAANATASSTVQVVDGWLLRAAPGLPFRRANATVPLPGSSEPTLEVAARIELVEHFYRSRGLAPRFQLSPAAVPFDLDARLAARGYTIDAPVDIYVARAPAVLKALAIADLPVARVEGAVDLEWIAAYADVNADAHDLQTRARIEGYAQLLSLIGPRSATALIEVGGRPAAIGLGVLERGWVGIFGMATRSNVRRQGGARAVLQALARWGTDEKAPDLYLQAETDNEPARALYESVGFVRNHGYHYRVLA